jgi:putative transposase
MIKTFKFRLYPTTIQIKSLNKTFDLCRFLYNSALQERISYYKKYKKSISYISQAKHLKEIKEDFPDFKNIYSQVLQSNLKRLDLAYQSFFRRVKKGEKAGFPRFKNKNRLNSILYPQSGFSIGKSKGLKNKKKSKLKLSKIGNIPMILHRNIPGNIKTCQVIKSPSDKWYVCLTCEVLPEAKPNKSGKDVGIDLGVKNLVTMSNGDQISNPKHFKKSHDKLAKLQKKLSKLDWRKKDQAKKRKAVKTALARQYEKVVNQRTDYYHKLSKSLVERFDKIYVEDLNIKGMKSWRVLNKEIQNAAWDKLVHMLLYKAESADKEVVLVNPKNTSSMCSCCGKIEKKDLSVRIHRCECGLIMDRDLNAAINIYNRGRAKALPRESGDTFSELSRSPRL